MKTFIYISFLALGLSAITSFSNNKWEGCYEYRVKCPNASSFKEVIKAKSSSDAKNRMKAKYPSCEINLSRTVECE